MAKRTTKPANSNELDGKEFVGRLLSYEDGGVTLEMDGAPVDFGKQEIALVRLYPRF